MSFCIWANRALVLFHVVGIDKGGLHAHFGSQRERNLVTPP